YLVAARARPRQIRQHAVRWIGNDTWLRAADTPHRILQRLDRQPVAAVHLSPTPESLNIWLPVLRPRRPGRRWLRSGHLTRGLFFLRSGGARLRAGTSRGTT